MKLSTDKGTNYQSILQLAMGAIVAMPEGPTKVALLVVNLLCMAFISWSTKGSGIEPDQAKEVLDVSKEISAVLKEGRRG